MLGSMIKLNAALIEHQQQKSTEAKSLLDFARSSSPASEPASPAVTDADLDSSPDGSSDGSSKADGPLVPHLKPNITISLVNEFGQHDSAKMQPLQRENMHVDPATNTYKPVVHMSEFWLLKVRMPAWQVQSTALKHLRKCFPVTFASTDPGAAHIKMPLTLHQDFARVACLGVAVWLCFEQCNVLCCVVLP